MNRFNAEHPDLDGDELREMMISAIEEPPREPSQSPYQELVSAVAITIKSQQDTMAKAEQVTAMVWRRAVMANSERLNKQVDAMLNLLEQDGHLTPMAARQISKLMDPNQNPHHG